MKKQLLSVLIGSTLSFMAFAQAPEGAVLAKFKKDYPALNVEKVSYIAPVKLYEFKTKGNLASNYTNETLDFFLVAGEIIDPKNKKNISVERQVANAKQFYKDLPFDKAITVKYGKGTRSVAIFTDPDCPYCKRTDRDLHSKLTNSDITIHYFMNPLNIQGHENAPEKARKIWCSPNRSKAWLDWMLRDQLPSNPGTCKNPVAETKEYSTRMGFNSTPTIIFDNGYILTQETNAEQIKEVLGRRN